MIELRWLKRYPVPPYEAAKVLQFRTQVMQMGYEYSTHGMGFKWSEWTNVPTVSLCETEEETG